MTSFLLPNISIFSTVVRFSGKIKIPRQTGEMRENQGGCCEERNGEKRAHLIAVGGVGPLVDLTEYMDESSSEKNRDEQRPEVLTPFYIFNSLALEAFM